MSARVLAALAAAALIAGCTAAPQPAAFEVENAKCFKLTDAKVVELEGAGGGKAVVLTTANGEAVAQVVLPPGTYNLVVYGYAPSYNEDRFYVTVGDYPEAKMVMSAIKKVAPSNALKFKVDKLGPVKIRISFGEDNVQFDRVLITPAVE